MRDEGCWLGTMRDAGWVSEDHGKRHPLGKDIPPCETLRRRLLTSPRG